jgi:myosin-light-chain kinase
LILNNIQTIIFRGKFGKVYRCREKSTGIEFAAKRIALKRDADRELVEHEVTILQQMRHPLIAQIYDAFYLEHDIVLVMEM